MEAAGQGASDAGRRAPNGTWNHGGIGCKCAVCGTTRDTDDLNAHSFPYLFDPHFLGGKRVSSCTCADCGYVKKTDFGGHIYEYTCAPGSSQHKGVCTICGKQILSQHNFSDGVCTYCGYRPGIDLRKTVTEFATRASLSMDESELDGMERKLLCWPKATPRRPPSLIFWQNAPAAAWATSHGGRSPGA